jgi:hypothetical protein
MLPSSKVVRLGQKPLGHLLANHAALLTDAMVVVVAEAKRAFALMMEMEKIDITKIEAARRR